MKDKKRIALFGGSFDPIHTDHLNISIACHEQLKFDEVWLIPTYLNPFKTRQNSSTKDRLSMLRIIESKYSFIRINEYEIQNTKPSYTYETLKWIVNEYPDIEFAFIMGSDQLDSFESWNEFNNLIKLMPFKVFLREDNYNHEICQKYSLETFKFNNNHLSSTDIRELKNLNKQIPEINEYINNNLLYLHDRLENQMDHKRFEHCLNVGQMAKKLASKFGEDEQKAFIAGTLHDITKRWTEEKAISYLRRYMPGLMEEPKPTWHSFTGYLHLEKDWFIKDQDILQAVFNHTVGSPDMSKLDIIIFCADKISSEREYPGVQELRDLCFKDLMLGFKELLKHQYERAIEKNGKDSIGLKLKETYKYWIEGVKE